MTQFYGRPGLSGSYGLSGLPSALASGSTLLNGLVYWWDMDETSGVRVEALGTGEDLVDINTVTSASGKIGNAASFDAANSETLRCPTYKPSGVGFTLAGWARPESNVDKTIFSNLFGLDGITCYVNATDQLVSLAGNGTALADASSAAGSITLNEWNFIVVWRDSDANTWNTQINNGAVTSAAMTGAISTPPGDYRLSFFADAATGSSPGANHQTGELDLVGVWNRHLTADERTELYNLGASIKNDFTDNGEGFRQDLVHHWKLDETSGTRVDSVGSSDLTDVNTVTSVAGKDGNASRSDVANNEYLRNADVPVAWSGDWTVSFWVRPTWEGSTDAVFCGGVNEHRVYMLADGQLTGEVDGANTATKTGLTTDGTVWYHSVMAHNNATGKAQYYIDGAQVSSDITTDPETDDGNVVIHAANAGGIPSTSDMDDVMIWERALNADEVSALYNSGSGRFYDFNTLG